MIMVSVERKRRGRKRERKRGRERKGEEERGRERKRVSGYFVSVGEAIMVSTWPSRSDDSTVKQDRINGGKHPSKPQAVYEATDDRPTH